MTFCALCRQEGPLRQSHIFADCCYRNVYADTAPRAIGVHVDNGQVTERIKQSGEWEYLLCGDCEDLLNKHETYFARTWLDHPPFTPPLTRDTVLQVTVDYCSFKLFHLANLWRAGACSRPAFAQVTLGKHHELLRRMLLGGDPGPPSRYPIVVYGLIEADGSLHNRVMSPVVPTKIGGHTVYSVIHSGFDWLIRVSSHSLTELDGAALRADGSLGILVVPAAENPLVRGIAVTYARHKSKART